MLQNTKHGSQDHGEILATKASNSLEDCKWMRGWIARNLQNQKHGPQEHGPHPPDSKASKPLQEDCKWIRGWMARSAA